MLSLTEFNNNTRYKCNQEDDFKKRKQNKRKVFITFIIYTTEFFFFLNNKHTWRIEVRGETYFNHYPCEIVRLGESLTNANPYGIFTLFHVT